MDENSNVQKNESGRKCFVITPIGNDGSDTFRRAKGVIESAIKPVLMEYGFVDIKPAYEINVSGMINTQIINRIIDDDLVIANLTDNNPNVMYELCLRHVVAKPIIHICENGTELPFDIKDSRTVFYEDDMLGVEELKEKVRLFLDEITYEKEYMDNPVYVAYRHGKLLKETIGTEENEILKMLVGISEKLSGVKMESAREIKPDQSIINDTLAYTVGQFIRDVSCIENSKIEEVRNMNKGMKVYELAKQLNTTSKAILNVSKIIRVDARAMASDLSSSDVNMILDYILTEIS